MGKLFGVLLLLAAAPVAARPNPVVWYRHATFGGGENGDWVCLRRKGPAVVGTWLSYRAGPDRRPALEAQPFVVEPDRDAWVVSTWSWDGGFAAWLRYYAFHARWGQSRLTLVNSEASTGATNYTFNRSAPPRFVRNRSMVGRALRVLAERLKREEAR
jgi:hypothetical protein